MATSAIIAGLLGAGGAIGGGLLSSQGGTIGTSDIGATGFIPGGDPLLSAAQLGLLGQIGGPTAGVTQQASPLARLQNLPGTGALGFSQRDQARLNNAIAFVAPIIEAGTELGIPADVIERAAVNFQAQARRGSRPPTDEKGILQLAANRAVTPEELTGAIEGGGGLGALKDLARSGRPIANKDANIRAQLFQRAIAAAGFGSLSDLVEEQVQFGEQATAQEEAAAGVQPDVLAGITAAQQRIAQLQQDFPIPTMDQIENFRTQLVDRQAAEFLERANVAGINPSGGLGQIQNDPQTLANAVQLFGGIQGLGQQALSTLQQSLLGPLGFALQGAQIGGNLQQGAAQLAQDQSLALAQLQAQQQASQNVSLGQGIAGGFQSAADIFGTLGAQRQQTQQQDFLRDLFGRGRNVGTPGVLQGQELQNFQLPGGGAVGSFF